MSLVAGVDVGATKTEACIVDPETGDLIGRARIPTLPQRGGELVLADCVELVASLHAGPLDAVGIGLCEFVSPDGRPTSAITVDWRTLDVAGAFARLAPVRIDNDVRAAARAEGRFGAGTEIAAPWAYVSVGSGVACTLMIDGRPFAGARGNAIVLGAPPVEQVAGGFALERAAGRPRAEDVIADPTCAAVVEDGARALGQALAALVNALDPSLLVIGGGLGLVESYRTTAVDAMRPLIDADGSRTLPVVAAALGTLAGPLGAALLASEPVS